MATATAAPRAGFPEALVAEWTKLRSVRSSGWSLAGLLLLTVLFAALVCASHSTEGAGPGGGQDVVMLSLFGIYFGQLAAMAFAVIAVTSEYGTGLIRATFAANPRRRTVLAAKALVVAAPVLIVGTVASFASFLVGQAILHGNGFVAANGYPAASLADGDTLRAVVGTGLYVTAVALLSLGVGAILRHTAAAITVMAGLVFLPVIAGSILGESAADWIERLCPTVAGFAVQATTDREFAIAPLAGLGVTFAYAAAALLAAAWLIQRRDA
jgi:ABC-2 type transport system permease protein